MLKVKKLLCLIQTIKFLTGLTVAPNFIKADTQISSSLKVTDTNYSVSDIFENDVTEISKYEQTNITFEK